MLRPRIMPCLLLKDGSLVKTVKFKKPSYVGDAVNAIKFYYTTGTVMRGTFKLYGLL